MSNEYSQKIKFLRERLFLTQADLAKRIGVSFATVYRWENGRFEPSMRYKKVISSLYDEASK